jgi:hypothetical protein
MKKRACKRQLFISSIVVILFMCSSVIFLSAEEFAVAPPPFSKGIFPCSQCHDSMPVNTHKRVLTEEHTSIKLHHAESMRWCLDCHNAKNRDRLRLYNGETIPFTESYRLCGECHGNIYRDWKIGIHGKRSGYFSGGKRIYYLCASCHDPHNPKFKPLKPEPPPLRPLE